MVVNLQVAEFMYEDIVYAVDWHFHEIQVQENIACFGATAPSLRHAADRQSWFVPRLERRTLFQAQLHPKAKGAAGVLTIPSVKKLLDPGGIGLIADRDLEEPADQFDGFL